MMKTKNFQKLKLTPLEALTHKIVPKEKQWKIFAGDKVQIITGPEAGKQGTVKKVLRKLNKILVEGVNQQRNRYKEIQSGVTEGKLFDKPIDFCMVSLIDPATNKPTKVKLGYLEDGTKVRVCLETGSIIPTPNYDHMKYENKYQNRPEGLLDTPSNLAHKLTYQGEDFEWIEEDFKQFIQEKQSIEKWLVFDK